MLGKLPPSEGKSAPLPNGRTLRKWADLVRKKERSRRFGLGSGRGVDNKGGPMSGSSGGGSGGGGGYDDAPCERVRFEAQITSPQAPVVATISVGDVLDVIIATMQNVLVVQVLKNGQVAGGLAGPDASRLRNCMEQGYSYRAVVLSVLGGQVRVRVELA